MNVQLEETRAFVNPPVLKYFQSSDKSNFVCRKPLTQTPYPSRSCPRAVLKIKPQSKPDSFDDSSDGDASDTAAHESEISSKLEEDEDDGEAVALLDEPDEEAYAKFGDWYTVEEEAGHSDTGDENLHIPSESADGVLDLGSLHGATRSVLTRASYESVVDIDIEEGGVLEDDEDNNEFFCGVGFEALVENETLVENLQREFQIETATHVQLHAIPRVTDGKDLVIQSHTGTGKTLAFLLPILDEIDENLDEIQAVIVAPTRELAMQISRECDRLIVNTELRNLALIGGANPIRQVEKLRKLSPHIVIGTPGRLVELHHQRELKLRSNRFLVIDEVDHCLGDAFMEHIVSFVTTLSQSQKILVSATGDVDSVRQFARSYLHNPVLLRVGGTQKLPKGIYHFSSLVPARMKIEMVKKLMNAEPVPTRAIAFVNDPRRVEIVMDRLHRMGCGAGALRGNADKRERADVLAAFRKGKVNLLVTTEVAARGLDVKDITHVFNLDLPTDGDHYLHRAGRCGRAGGEGVVVSIISSENSFVVDKLAKQLGIHITRMELRRGVYAKPIERVGRPDTGARKEGQAPKRNPNSRVEPEKRRAAPSLTNSNDMLRNWKPSELMSIDSSMESLRDAIQTDETEYLERLWDENNKVAVSPGEGSKGPKKIKEKKKGKLKAKAKAKAALAKSKAKDKKTKTAAKSTVKKEKTEEEKAAAYYALSEKRYQRKLRKNASLRAKTEGWVGNR